jgi:DNA polymerase V
MQARRYAKSRKGIGGRPRGEPTTVIRLPLAVADIARRVAQRGLRAGDVAAFLEVEGESRAAIPLAATRAACGFPSPADDYLDRPLDFNELLIQNPAATFAVRLESESMTGIGLLPGDIAIVNRALSVKHGDIVLALISGEFTVKRFEKRGERITLRPENPAFPAIEITEGHSLEIWGVITGMVRQL